MKKSMLDIAKRLNYTPRKAPYYVTKYVVTVVEDGEPYTTVYDSHMKAEEAVNFSMKNDCDTTITVVLHRERIAG